MASSTQLNNYANLEKTTRRHCMVGARHPSCTIDNCLAEGETRHAQLVIHGVWFASSESGEKGVPCGPTVSARQLVPGGCDRRLSTW